jgi:glycerate kinase
MAKRAITVCVAPDSFKGTMTALQAAVRIERGLRKAWPAIRVRKVPMADGGEGTVAAIVDATGGQRLHGTVSDPLGRPVRAVFGLTGDGRTAVIEMAEASGLVRLEPAERNPLETSTFGTGELIRKALDRGARRILIGIGGSATNDGGCGMARALGVRFLDSRGRELGDGGGALAKLARIDASGLDPRLKRAAINVACDVENPLCGPRGASRVYGPQKGATPAMVRTLDASLRRLARVVQRDMGIDILNLPGAGAAGGLGAGLVAFAGGSLRRGVDMVIDCVQLEQQMRGCGLVITGEGRIDGQTVYGKTPAGVARVARKLKIPVVAICGMQGEGVAAVHGIGIDAVFSTLAHAVADDDIARFGPARLTDLAEQVGRLIRAVGRL